MSSVYPEIVEQRINESIAILKSEDYLKENNIDEEVIKDLFGQIYLPKFIKGEKLILTIEEYESLIRESMAQSTLNSLMNKGLIDGIEDEHGEMVYFLTPKGKELGQKLDNLIK